MPPLTGQEPNLSIADGTGCPPTDPSPAGNRRPTALLRRWQQRSRSRCRVPCRPAPTSACRGRDEVRAFATKFRAAFPDLSFSGTADLIAEGDYVVGQWEGGGTQTGDAFDDMPIGSLPPNSGKTMRFTGITILKVENGLITEELGLDDGVTVLRQLELISQA